MIDTPTRLGIERAIENTTKLEAVHVIGIIPLLYGSIQDFYRGHTLAGALFVAVNILVNVYPIMLQRCNRAKMLRVLYPRNEDAIS